MTAVPPRTSRRGVLVGGLAALATTGCDAATPPQSSGTGPRPGTARSPSETPAVPDEALVADVQADLARAFALVASVVGARPGLRRELAPFVRLHTRHLRALDGDEPRGNRRQVRGGAAAVRATVRAHEARLETSLASAALAAQSGPLAALLASMSAAVAQQLAATT